MWRDICIANADALSAMLARFGEEMTDLADSIRRRDADHLLDIFSRAKAARDAYVDGVQPAGSLPRAQD
jgi:prephenate dehydrogenase